MLAHSIVTWYNMDMENHAFSTVIASLDSFLIAKTLKICRIRIMRIN
mgnify:CR=1 FL=1